MLSDDGSFRTASVSGLLGVATGYGLSITSSGDAALSTAEKIQVNNKYYRTDLSDVLSEEYNKICDCL
jgi:hypothetical protein